MDKTFKMMIYLIILLLLEYVESLTPGVRLTSKFVNKMNTIFSWTETHFVPILGTIIAIVIGSYFFIRDENKILSQAAAKGDINTIENCLKRGADPNYKGSNGVVPLVEAAREGQSDAVRLLLLNGADVNLQDTKRGSALIAACYNGVDEVVSELLSAKALTDSKREADQVTPLQIACSAGHLYIVKMILAKGCDIGHKNKSGATAMMVTISVALQKFVKVKAESIDNTNEKNNDKDNNLEDKTDALKNDMGTHSLETEEKYLEIIKSLHAAGANVNCRNRSNYTPLMLACRSGHIAMIKFLIQLKADINADTVKTAARTALTHACLSAHPEAVKLLLAHGANPNIPQDEEDSDAVEAYPPLLAICSLSSDNYDENIVEEIATMLINAGANVSAKYGAGLTSLSNAANSGQIKTMNLLINHKVEVDSHMDNGWNILMAAADGKSNQATEAVKLLLKSKPTLDSRSSKGWTAIHSAAMKGRSEMIKLLIDAGCKCNRTNIYKPKNKYIEPKGGLTPLHMAAHEGHVETVKILLAMGKKKSMLDAKDAVGNTALLACARGANAAIGVVNAAGKNHLDVAQALIDAGADTNICNHDGLNAAGIAQLLSNKPLLKLLTTSPDSANPIVPGNHWNQLKNMIWGDDKKKKVKKEVKQNPVDDEKKEVETSQEEGEEHSEQEDVKIEENGKENVESNDVDR